MLNALQNIKEQAVLALAQVSDPKVLDELRVKYLGKKGELTAILKQMGKLSAEERPKVGAFANEVRASIEQLIEQKAVSIKTAMQAKKLEQEKLDVTLPGTAAPIGKAHPLNKVLDEIKEIFLGMGFSIAEGPEVELDYYNFEALNIPKNHPARDTQDTFYISDNVVLRTQTSPVQVRVMENQLGGGQGNHDGGFKGYVRDVCQTAVWRGIGGTVPSASLPLYRTFRRTGRSVFCLQG